MKIIVPGRPVPQGNHRASGYKIYETSKGHKQWRANVKRYAEHALADYDKVLGPVSLTVEFYYLRPQSHLKLNGELRKGKPGEKVSSPDLSKLVRCIEDSLTDAGVWEDDSRVVECLSSKHYGPIEMCRIQVLPYTKESEKL